MRRALWVAMENLVKLTGAAIGGLFLASCVTYPYQSAFTSCEQEANSCYRVCEDIPDESGYIACQSHCDRSIDRCFDQAYTPYRSGYGYGYTSYGYSSPWYGRYGSWYPDSGYYLSFNFYDRYGYRQKRHHPRRDYEYKNDRNHPPRTSTPPRVYDNERPTAPPGRPYTGPRRRPDNPGERDYDRSRNPDRLDRRGPSRRLDEAAPSSEAPGTSDPAPAYTPPASPQTDIRSRDPDRMNRRGPARRFEPAEPSESAGASSAAAPAYRPPPRQPRSAPPPSSQAPETPPPAQAAPPERPQRGEGRRRPVVEPDEEIE